MRAALTRTLTATTLAAAVAGVVGTPLAGAAAANSTVDERRAVGFGKDANSFADAHEEAVLARPEAAPAPAVLSYADVARKWGDEPVATMVTGDPVTRTPVTQRARGPPRL